MKQIKYFLYLITVALFFACSSEEELSDGMGYLSLSVNGSNETVTKALPEGYTGKQLAVEIVNSNNVTVEETDDWTTWQGKLIGLTPGEYTIKAYSYGFDGKTSHMAAPYYYGSKTVTIESGKTLNETVTCKLANVKVSVKISDDIREKFKTFSVSVKAKDGSCDALTFDIDLKKNAITDTAYFPATELVASYSATNMSDKLNSAERELGSAKNNDHYILNFTLAASGTGNVTVDVDESMRQYTYTFVLSQTSSNSAIITPNAWAKFAYVTATATTASGVTLDPEKMVFQYKPTTETDWANAKSVKATQDSENATTYKATLPDLTPNIAYQCRLTDGTDNFVSSATQFITEINEALYNGSFDEWYERDNNNTFKTKTWFACSESYYNKNGGSFWDSSNPGTTLDAGALVNINPTTGDTKVVHTSGGQSAKLTTNYKVKLAAASLYVGAFGGLEGMSGAKINFGQPFTSRPIALKGYFQYAPVTIDYEGSNQPANTVSKGDMDVCSIYIILSKGTYQLNNTITETLLTEEKVFNNDQFIAYGELPAEQCVSTNGEWKEFNIPLKYKEGKFDETPTHLIIVCTSSKYGDYFTGGAGSTLYLDDFELVYDGEPTIWK